MSSPLPFPPPGFDQLSRDEKLDYVDELLDYVTLEGKYVEVPDWHLEIIRERMARYRESGMTGRTWEEFEKELENQS